MDGCHFGNIKKMTQKKKKKKKKKILANTGATYGLR
jgi:hypothetical protein